MAKTTLIRSRRFFPFFATQFLGAFNDNVLKQSVILTILFYMTATDSSLMINLCALVFILPFFLFSALGGRLGEAIEKSRLIRALKIFEIVTMIAAVVGMVLGNLWVMMGALFATGIQSALFGPVKYSILPQHLADDELISGNAWVEMGTFMAILLGTLTAGLLMASNDYVLHVCLTILSISVLGTLSSLLIPPAPSLLESKPKWRGYNPVSETWCTLTVAFRQKISVSRSLIGNSWFWFIGAVYLTQIPELAKTYLGGDEGVVTLILIAFSLGIGVGSLMCERLSGGKIEIGLVPLGSIGLTVFGIALYFNLEAFSPAIEAVSWRVMLDEGTMILANIFLLGMFGGYYIVPLYALMQARSKPDERSRVIAAGNILNALFMVLAAGYGMLMLSVFKFTIPELLLTLALLNLAVNAYLFKIVPEFLMRFIIWIVLNIAYRVRTKGLNNIPDEGAAVLVCNHISFVDALLICGAIRRPVRFVMYYKIFQWPVLSFVFKVAGAIPIAGRKEDPEIYASAFEKIAKCLDEGELVCIFPEGRLTADGEIGRFMPGVRMILNRTPVPVIPMALQGLWGSYFSRDPGRGAFKRRWSKVTLLAGPMLESQTPASAMKEVVQDLRGENR